MFSLIISLYQHNRCALSVACMNALSCNLIAFSETHQHSAELNYKKWHARRRRMQFGLCAGSQNRRERARESEGATGRLKHITSGIYCAIFVCRCATRSPTLSHQLCRIRRRSLLRRRKLNAMTFAEDIIVFGKHQMNRVDDGACSSIRIPVDWLQVVQR